MKYGDVIDFNPITSVIKLVDDSSDKLRRNVETFVFSKKMIEDIAAQVIPNLDTTTGGTEQKGIAIVGSYGTGKSHLMSVISAVAQDADMLKYVQSGEAKDMFSCFAGKYMVLRFELGTDKPLRDILFTRIEDFLQNNGLDYHFDAESRLSYKELLQNMMGAFEEKFPDKYFLIVIDELLEYLKGRDPIPLNQDLSVLRQIGEMCDGSRFKVIYGVQELLYRDPELSHAATAINHASDRFSDLIITREDVAYVIENRLLKKSASQKQAIREHLNQFSHLFSGINTQLNEYVDLFPVHPSYISKFEQIKHGKSQREILKTLSAKFMELKDKELPSNEPGLITYDEYFEVLKSDASMIAVPDIRKIKDNVDTINDKIDGYFVAGRAGKKDLAKRITNAIAICALCDDLDKHSGASAENLKENLCLTLPGIDDPGLLKETIESTASQLVKATMGQYVVREEQTEDFYIRTEGGINIEQVIKDYADTVVSKSPSKADTYFNQLLQYLLELSENPYRAGFPIWDHSIEWKTAKSYQLGYIFFGTPDERSTTEPIQEFYMFFCPLFGRMERNNAGDEIYFDLTGLSGDFKQTVYLFGAAHEKIADATSDLKPLFERYFEQYRARAVKLFNAEYVDATKVIYNNETHPFRTYQLPPEGSSRKMAFDEVAARVLDKHFNDKYPEYPHFDDLPSPLTPGKDGNLDRRVQDALRTIFRYGEPNGDGHAMLSGLGLSGSQNVETNNSKYADALRKLLASKGEGKVLNRDEVLETHDANWNMFYSKDNHVHMDYRLEFIVLAAMVFTGDIEICWDGYSLTASNIGEKLLQLDEDQYYSFRTLKKPSDLPVKALKKLFACLTLPDLTADLLSNSNINGVFSQLQSKLSGLTQTVATTLHVIQNGVKCRSIVLLDDKTSEDYKAKLQALLTILDGISNLNTPGKLRGFTYTEQELADAFASLPLCNKINGIKEWSDKLENLIAYLTQAQHCVVESEKPLYDDMQNAVNDLSAVLATNDNKKLIQYESRLNSLKDSYADYYLSQYQKARLSYNDSLKKDKLLAGDTKRICDVIKDVSILNRTEYENWLNAINSLKAADPSVTKAGIKENAYQEFNPRENYSRTMYNVNDLGTQLETILDKWQKALLATFKDPNAKDNMHLLNPTQKKFAEEFSSGQCILTVDNAASLRDTINELVKGFDKVELNADDFASVFARPLTIEEAKEQFTQYLDEKCAGKEHDKVRIILSGK
jgi:hypothetical protein